MLTALRFPCSFSKKKIFPKMGKKFPFLGIFFLVIMPKKRVFPKMGISFPKMGKMSRI
jgi:hypothetical protein